MTGPWGGICTAGGPPTCTVAVATSGSLVSVPEFVYRISLTPGSELDAAVALAKRITVNAPIAVREALRVAREGVMMSDAEAFRLSNQRMAYLSTTPDFREGPLAFAEKREAKWTGLPGVDKSKL